MSTATDTANGIEKVEDTENKDDNESIGEPDINEKNDENKESPNINIETPILKKQITSTTVTKQKSKNDIRKKLRNILEGVTSQETDLKKKTLKLEEWYNIHTETLVTATNTKKMLHEFDVINDDDTDEIKNKKTKNKTDINNNLDLLEKELKKINILEKKYRSRESIKEINELTNTVKKLQDKYKILSQKFNQQISDLDKLTKVNNETENKYKILIENNKKSMDEMKKSIENKHKNYITNLQSQHENLLKKQKEENISNSEKKIEELKNEMTQLKTEHSARMESQINTLKIVNEELSEYKLRETAHKELMLKWQAQKEKKNQTINELSKNIIKIERLEETNQKLQENAALNAIQMTTKDETLNEFDNKYNILNEKQNSLDKDKKLLEAKLKVSIKEIIKLRGESKNKDENKTILLTEMSNLEIDKNKKINCLKTEINKYENEILLINKEFIKQFEILGGNLNDVHSKLESFSVTIRNFSGSGLKQSYNNDVLEASKKSNQELPAWQDNIREQVRKATEQISLNSVTGQNVNQNESNEKQQKIIKECEAQIAHIKLTGLQLLDEYTSLLIGYNDLYILHYNYVNKDKNDKQSNNKNIFSKRKKSNQNKTSNQ